MTVFTQAMTGAPTGTSVAPKQAVQEVSTIAGVASVGEQLLGLANTADRRNAQLATQESSRVAKEEETAVDQMLGNYQRELQAIASKLRTSDMTLRTASTLRRNLRSKYLAMTDGRYSKDLLALESAYEKTSTGKVFVTGGEAEIQRAEELKGASEEFYITSTMTEEQKELGRLKYLAAKKEQQARAEEMELIALEASQLELGNKRRVSLLADQKTLATDALKKASLQEFSKITNFGNELVAQKDNGGDPAKLVRELRFYRAKKEAELTQIGEGVVDKSQVELLSNPIFRQLDNFEKVLNNEMDKETLTALNEAQEARARRFVLEQAPSTAFIEAIVNGSSEMDRLLAPDRYANIKKLLLVANKADGDRPYKLGGGEGGSLLDWAIDLFTSDGTSQGDDLKDKAEFVEEVLESSLQEGSSPDHVREGKNMLEGVLIGLDVYRSAIDSPEKMEKALNIISKPSFAQGVKKFGLQGEALQGAKDVYEQQYADEVYPVLATKFYQSVLEDSAFSRVKAEDLPAPIDVLDVRINNGVISFELKDNLPIRESTTTLKPRSNKPDTKFSGEFPSFSKAMAYQYKQRANKFAKKVLSPHLRIEAHLSGREDYDKVFEEVLGPLLGYGEKSSEDASQELTEE